MKTERVKVYCQSDNLQFLGSMIKVMNLWTNQGPEREITSINTLTLKEVYEAPIQIELKTIHDQI